jgi:hypothetical protein
MTGVPVGVVLGLIDILGGDRDDIIDTPLSKGWRVVEDEVRLIGSASIIAWEAANRNDPVWQMITSRARHSRGGDGPSALTQSPSSSSENSRQDRAMAQVGKPGAPARASQRGSRPRRGSCPKGHYWSFKHKECVKSKFKSR